MPSRRKSGIRLTDEETAIIREKLIEGHSYHQVAEIVERSVSTIFRVANELKAEDPVFRDCRQQRRLSEPEVQEWYKMKGVNKLYAPYVTKVSEQRKSSKKTQKVNVASLLPHPPPPTPMFNLLQAQLPSIFPPFPIMMQQGEIGTMSLQQQQQQMYHYGQFLHQCMIQTHAQQMAAFYQKMSETLASNESLPSSRRTTTDNSLHNSTAGTPKLEKDKDSDEFLKFNPDLFNSLFNYKIDTDDC